MPETSSPARRAVRKEPPLRSSSQQSTFASWRGCPCYFFYLLFMLSHPPSYSHLSPLSSFLRRRSLTPAHTYRIGSSTATASATNTFGREHYSSLCSPFTSHACANSFSYFLLLELPTDALSFSPSSPPPDLPN